MNWKLFAVTFSAVFFAELADKTQMVGVTLASRSQKPLTVWLGSVSAYIIVTALSVLIGSTLGRFIRPELIKYTAASLFILVGAFMLIGKL
ncbi:MAG: hypothetical protein DRP74_00015 [Candidatus Omnitrophota bacterium]|nr:MAG: hypothetical protein DRP74_00015 [Candidatus Omnitrophota bacterium]